jgi:predicted GTPase
MKKALLKEVAAVAIDLYRGHFKLKDKELPQSNEIAEDAPNIDPLRVAIVGQVGAGKSSLINALKQDLVASIDVLPDTEKAEKHNFMLEHGGTIELIDLPGMDGSAKTEELILKRMIESDIILWVLKADQPARKLDLQIKQRFDDFYQEPKNRGRKKPLILFLLNQIDRLKPVSEWNPPYNITSCDEDDRKCHAVRDAAAYNKELLGVEQMLTLSISLEKAHYNLDSITAYLEENYKEGISIQLNRRKMSYSGSGFTESSEKFIEGGKAIYEALKK